MIYVLDASAIIAWMRNEPGADVVDNAIRDVNSQCLVHAVNLCKVYYDGNYLLDAR
jgi:PIN domain nuclease of toxin-antitoxin system